MPALSILLTGATGYVGGLLLSLLESRGHQVRCLARRPGRLRQRADAATEIVEGDARDSGSLSLGVVVGILAMSVVASLLRPKTTGSFEGPGGPASLGA